MGTGKVKFMGLRDRFGSSPRGGGAPAGGDDDHGPIWRFFSWYLTRCGEKGEHIASLMAGFLGGIIGGILNIDTSDVGDGRGSFFPLLRWVCKWMVVCAIPLLTVSVVLGFVRQGLSFDLNRAVCLVIYIGLLVI